MTDNIAELLNEIQSIENEGSFIEKILSWCEETETDPMEIGELFAINKHIREIIWIDAVNFNQVNDPLIKKKLNETEELDEWE